MLYCLAENVRLVLKKDDGKVMAHLFVGLAPASPAGSRILQVMGFALEFVPAIRRLEVCVV